LHGTGIEADDKEAVLWLTLASKQGHVEATGELGTLFRFGRGVPQDFLMAAELHIDAAKSGDGISHGNLADYRGDLEKLALDGSAGASLALAKICEAGLGTDADFPLALAWVRWFDTLIHGPWEPSQLEERDTLRVKLEAAQPSEFRCLFET
jgi:TPR repeat protein